jgi:hypothetical protein
MMATTILTLWYLTVWIFIDDVGSTTRDTWGRACTGPQTETVISGIATTSPVGLAALRGAFLKAIMGSSFPDFAGMVMFDANLEGIEGTGLFVSFASLTALVFG